MPAISHSSGGDYVPMLRVRPNYSVSYLQYQGSRSGRIGGDRLGKSIKKMSEKSGQRLKERLGWWIEAAQYKSFFSIRDQRQYRFRLNFITLTLPSKQRHSDSDLQKILLQPLLNNLRNTWGCHNYVWRAEKQLNGNIHWHIMTDTFIHWSDLRRVWNGVCEQYEYVSRGKTFDPNSTDIHAIKGKSESGRYLAKYFGKSKSPKHRKALNDQLHQQGLQGNRRRKFIMQFWKKLQVRARNWGCSYSISRLEGFTVEYGNQVSAAVQDLPQKNTEHACIYYTKASELGGTIRRAYYDYVHHVRRQLEPPKFYLDNGQQVQCRPPDEPPAPPPKSYTTAYLQQLRLH